MEFKIDKEYLYNRLQYAQEISENGNINIYYSYFIFDIRKNSLCIKSADRQTTLEIRISPNKDNHLEIIQEGIELLPGNKIYSIISSLPNGIIIFKKQEYDIIIQPENSINNIKFSIRPRNAEDYPTIHPIIPKEKYEINKSEFLKIITNTSFAASTEVKDTTLFLTGIFFEIKNSFLSAIATDRNRISISKMKLEQEINFDLLEENDLIIPSKSLNFIKKILQKENTRIHIAHKENKMFFILDEFLISSNIISGKYYNYSRILPTGKRNSVKVSTKDLALALERVVSIADDKKDTIVTLSIKQNFLTLIKEEKEKGAGTETIEAELAGNEKTLQVKVQFLFDPLRVINTDTILIEYGDEPRDLIKILSIPAHDTLHLAVPISS